MANSLLREARQYVYYDKLGKRYDRNHQTPEEVVGSTPSNFFQEHANNEVPQRVE